MSFRAKGLLVFQKLFKSFFGSFFRYWVVVLLNLKLEQDLLVCADLVRVVD